MKKTTKTTKTKALTPAPKTAKAVKQTAAAPAAKKAKAVVKPTATSVTVTTITAKIDVGFGNTLFLRGEGPGLSWEKGIPLNCVSDTEWSLNLSGATNPVVFKFLLNDALWSVGEDFNLAPGKVGAFAPEF